MPVPSVAEMEAALGAGGGGGGIPSIADLEQQLAAPRVRAKRAPKPKPPCKYGPRTAEGKCPKKPKRSPSGAQLAGLSYTPSSPGSRTSSKRAASGTPFLEKLALGTSKEIGQQAVRQVLPSPTRLFTKKKAAAASRAGVREAAKTVGEAAVKVGSKARVLAALPAASLGAASVALLGGVAAYYATSYILNKLEEKRLKNTPEYRKYEAALAYRQSRLEAASRLGRELTAEEQTYLAAAFKQHLQEIGG